MSRTKREGTQNPQDHSNPELPPKLASRCQLDAADLLRHVMESMPSGMCTVDVSGRITSWNRAMEQLSGWRAAEVMGQPCTVLMWNSCTGAKGGPPSCEPCSLFKKGEINSSSCQLIRKDGQRVSVLKRGRVMRDAQGKTVGAIEVLTELTNMLELEEEIASLRGPIDGPKGPRELIGRHPSMVALEEHFSMAARSESSVLIMGETGTGKELVARGIHRLSPRSEGPFVQVSCAALNEGLLESELFGHVKGAFTGALVDRQGRFEAAHKGTIFLDEIGDVPLSTQARLLRVLQERDIERVGDNTSVSVDIRIIAATHRDLVAMCEVGDFRWDLYYRLCVIPLTVPPLRDRKSDLPLLAQFFISRLNRARGRHVRGLSPDALEALRVHDWPGNVRELENAIEYAFVLSKSAIIRAENLPPSIGAAKEPSQTLHQDAKQIKADRRTILAALEAVGGNRRRAAEALGVSRVTLWKWMKREGIVFRDSRAR